MSHQLAGSRRSDGMSDMAMSAKDKRFKDEYLIDLDVERAAVAAGFSKTVAKTKAYTWVSNGKAKPELFAAIEIAKAKREKRTGITQERVLAELAKIGFADIRKAVAWGDTPVDDGQGGLVYPVELIPSSQIDDDTAAAITEVSLTAQGVKIKMADKRAALETLLKHTAGDIDDDATSMTVTFNTAKPIKDIRVTRSTDGD